MSQVQHAAGTSRCWLGTTKLRSERGSDFRSGCDQQRCGAGVGHQGQYPKFTSFLNDQTSEAGAVPKFGSQTSVL
eukprot:5853136-Amphidinium_carterae.1